MDPKEKLLDEAARTHAGIPFNREIDGEERHFNSTRCNLYDAFKAGAAYQAMTSPATFPVKGKFIDGRFAVGINEAVEFYAAFLTVASIFKGLSIASISASAIIDGYIFVEVRVEGDILGAIYHLGDKKAFYERNPTLLEIFLEGI